ncbi:MAG: NAD(P)-dependent alcohol dehydrogenase [Gammaproteobacteria bacterium]|nr:NAD(P)-dependent alcohol dehydrogenase [Gammaproteobacteria bacterium]MDH4253327.1 NAD(P)-dependent alcohol dehydrogenase [Gammaproteobacteria bacterium]MDH5309936.1 NAD(P)-dependent alcohol dehydrogenase [Gammaproteobacteria bacterium]
MKKYQLAKGCTDLSGLKLVDCDTPKPGTGQVLIKVHATSLNYRDHAVVSGNYFGGVLKRDTVPLSDGAGEVVEVGPGVTRVRPGQRVAGTFFQVWADGEPDLGKIAALGSPLDGMLAEYVVLHEDGVVPIPEHLSYEEAATLPCAGVTAWNALMFSGAVRPGQSVLTLGTGGVSIFALQFAKLAGARVLITSSSDEKLARAKKLGADDVINYRKTPAWEQEVVRLTGRGVDHVIEVGGTGTLAKSFQSVGFRGQVALIGVLAGREGDTNPHSLMLKNASLRGIFVGSRRMFEDMNAAIAVNRLRPVVDKSFDFTDAAEAFSYQLAGKHFGKVAIRVAD